MIELLLLSYAGIVVHYLLKLKDASEKDQLDLLFTKKALIKELITNTLSIIVATLIVYVREDIKTIFVLTPASAIMAGYSGQSIFNNILGAKTPQVVKDKPNERTN